jgi:hypothetical protein
MTNEELVNKAITAAEDLVAGGKLNDVQSDMFIDFVIDVTELRGSTRTVRFRAENLNIDKIGVGQRVTVPKEEARDPGFRAGVQTSQVVLTPVELMTPWEVSDTFGEHSIEGEEVEDTIVRLMATQAANDYEELMINGDLLGPAQLESDILPNGGSDTQYVKDTFLAKFNGWLRLLDSGNVYDAEGSNISTKIFSGMIKSMPVKFRRTRRNLRFLMAMDIEQNWREKVSSRATAQGDRALTSTDRIPVFGVPMVPVPLLDPEPLVVEHFTLSHPQTVSLRYKYGVSSVVVTRQEIGKIPEDPYTVGTDYTVDAVAGTVTTVTGGAFDGAPVPVKITYRSLAQIMLADMNNLIMGIGRDIRIEQDRVRIEQDRDIFKGVNQFAITTKIAVQVEEVTATVKGINIGLD